MILKVNAGGYYVPLELEKQGKMLKCKFPFNRALIAEIKVMKGATWNPEKKFWTIEDHPRNWFNLRFLCGENVYAEYEKDLDLSALKCNYPKAYKHQIEMAAQMLQRKCSIIAGEMGTGKTLACIIFLENLPHDKQASVWYVAPKSALRGVEFDFKKWGTKIRPRFMTYDGMVKILNDWKNGDKAPHVVIFDESSKLKTPTTKRTEMAMQLADGVRKDNDGYVVLMSGSPAPKAPTDWWSQCEVACPGFLREGKFPKFKERLAIMKQETNPLDGAVFPKIVAWRDDRKKCDKCGKPQDDPDHTMAICGYVEAKNEVDILYQRMKGLVYVKMKKDCVDLPDKQYKIITGSKFDGSGIKNTDVIFDERLTVTPETGRLAKLVKASSRRAVQALMNLRELSDGIQYLDEKTGEIKTCTVCNGKGKTYIPEEDMCPACYGEGSIEVTERKTEYYPTPKDEILLDELDLHSDIGRLVVYAGFKGTIDKITDLCRKAEWSVIRVDGRGWEFTNKDGEILNVDPLESFQSRKGNIVFVGQPGSAGMGLTLTASPTILFYSNTFNGEDRIQSEDRIHRIGMDINRGATIKDIFHLPVDEYIWQNLRTKRKLQSISLGEIPV